jgi:hypothetical protein
MMKLLKKLFMTMSFAVLIAAPVMTLASPQPVYAGADCEKGILGMPVWFRGMTDDDCNILPPDSVPGGLSGFIWHIVLNITEMGLFLAGYVTLFFILYGGFLYLTGGSNPSQVEKAKKTLINATVGLVISIAAIGIVKLLFRVING